jgi:DNA mismatch repair protein MutS
MTFSLLWCDAASQSMTRLNDSYAALDLNITALVQHLAFAPQYEATTRAILLNLCRDETDVSYRQAILADLLSYPDFADQLTDALEAIGDLEKYLTQPQWQDTALQKVAWRISELAHYVDCVEQVTTILTRAGDRLQSEGLQKLRATFEDILNDPTFAQLRAELPTLLPNIRRIASVTVGINLDDELRPTTVTLLALNTEPFVGISLMDRLFRKPPQGQPGIAPLHNSRQFNMGSYQGDIELRKLDSPFMPPLFRDVMILLEDTSRPVVQALKKYTQINSQFLIALKPELAFYLGAVKFIHKLHAVGLSTCAPDIIAAEERTTALRGLYNVNLAWQLRGRFPKVNDVLVTSDAEFGAEGRVFILTGPNQGGKTTYIQAIGLAQLLGQAGLHVPATQAKLSLVDGIYTHFATEERPELEAGRLGEEARRLNSIFQRATRYSLILLNESLASTSVRESVFIGRDVLRIMRVMGVRAIFATHLHDLALECAALNDNTPGDSPIVSLISVVDVDNEHTNGSSVHRTYRIVRGQPTGNSYAIELAAKYGISFDLLMAGLRERKVVD